MLAPAVPTTYDRMQAQLPLARTIGALAEREWGGQRPTVIIGRHPSLEDALQRAEKYSKASSPILLTGETGTGKELFAQAIYLLSNRAHGPYISVNCAQYHESHLMASELFGHRKGSFTGAVADHRGIFEEADGGVVFLDEIGELSAQAQAMLLRALSEGEIMPVGATRPKRVNVRVIAATSRDLSVMIEQGTFRPDLYYRLRHLRICVPPVRARGADWGLITQHFLSEQRDQNEIDKRFSLRAQDLLAAYHWPGNVREIRSVVDTGFHMSDKTIIEPSDFAEALERVTSVAEFSRALAATEVAVRFERMVGGGETFWEVVHRPYLDRQISRDDARAIVSRGLDQTRGSFKRLLPLFHIRPEEYLRFMDFLRHQRLKPES
ncbi:MAG: sigma 54-interacting transcriptional regulator [Gemmatimonadales bacterium]|jgi:Nif-specific regulatory protein|nr:sigma 54-interacting transcriptional regulator [Gemmatimonadales bacterium]MBP9198444.1 sigma 54-interacting transcriptional regulator [Gemmatimonadales bacterium]